MNLTNVGGGTYNITVGAGGSGANTTGSMLIQLKEDLLHLSDLLLT